MAIGARLRKYRGLRNIKQYQLAKTLNISQGFLSEVEQGKKIPGGDILRSLKSNYPEINLNWLIAADGKMIVNAAADANGDGKDTENAAQLQSRMDALQRDNERLKAKIEALTDVLIQRQFDERKLVMDSPVEVPGESSVEQETTPAATPQVRKDDKVEVLDVRAISPQKIPALTPEIIESLEAFVQQGSKILEIVGGSHEGG